MGAGASKKKKSKDAAKSRKSSSSSSSSSSSKGGAKKLSIDGNNNRNELIDVVLEYVNTNRIKYVSYEYAARLKATEINWQWAIANGTSAYAQSMKPELQPTKNRRGWRNIRIYISSTFEEFEEERNILSKQVFTDLRNWCEERKLRLVDVDLRWGSKFELKGESDALLAINEINRCYEENTLPFFIGLVGERLGWIPDHDEVPRNIAMHYGWIYDFSLYEMEMLHAAYRMCNKNALILIRDPEFLQALPDPEKAKFLGSSELEKKRMQRLKEELRKKFPESQLFNYKISAKKEEEKALQISGLNGDETTLGYKVTQFFKARISELYPLDPTELDVVEERRQAHRNYMSYYADTSFSREEIISKIEKDLKEPTERSPILVHGDHGSGKSTILAQSAKRTIDLCNNGGIPVPNEAIQWKVLLHFVGSAPGSTDLVSFLERLLKETGQLKPEVFDDLDMIVQRARNVLAYGTVPIIIYIDAIDLIDSDQQNLLRRWLPPVLSQNVRVVLSTTTKSWSWKVLKQYSPPLSIVELGDVEVHIGKEILKAQLMKYGISLSEEDYHDFLNMTGSGSCLWLSLTCQYIVTYYSSKTIIELKEVPQDVNGLQNFLIGSLDSGSEHRLVMAALLLIYTSRRGLLERELRILLCTYEKSQDSNFLFDVLPYRRWAVIYDRLRPYLKTNASFGDGRLDFSHKSFSDVFENRFLSGGKDEIKKKTRSWHTILADHFKEEDDLDRKAEELPYHLEQLDDVEGLANCLADWEIFGRLFSFDVSSDLVYYWQKAGGYEAAGDRYKKELDGQEGKISDVDYSNLIERVINFDIQIGQYKIGIELLRKLAALEESKLGSRSDQMADIYQLLARCKSEIITTEETEAASLLPMEKEVVDYCERSIELRKKCTGDENKIKMGETFIMMTNHLARVADLEFVGKDKVRSEAEKAIDEAISIFDQLKDNGHKAEALMAKGTIYRNSDNEQEEKFTLAACDLCLQVFGEDHILSGELCRKVAIMYEENEKDLKSALSYYERCFKIFEMLFGDDHPKTEQLAELLAHEKFKKIKEGKEGSAEENAPAKTDEATLEKVDDMQNEEGGNGDDNTVDQGISGEKLKDESNDNDGDGVDGSGGVIDGDGGSGGDGGGSGGDGSGSGGDGGGSGDGGGGGGGDGGGG